MNASFAALDRLTQTGLSLPIRTIRSFTSRGYWKGFDAF
ncbi:hypothetical protein RBWH47_01699 [Rhodopirellula baltica WH47]|uniref:Uncharacterized protein n=3 Tax=Rhodopirellula baltica TaxID=265606 RepID=Q7UK13_RHOBA|nr:hypothetical protein RBWH47_01699 [Rhodopirellula baltica WH47]ELP31195.1 hypothetical protein RBSWK_04933 [Rhodopirellula baltica SWK14]CAD77068.1 hypothetical protein RB10926 [Rhodopirellula baltica SH 1]